MAKKKIAKGKSKSTSSSSSRKNLILFIPIIGIILFVWFLLLYIEVLPSSMAFNMDFETWQNILIIVFIILIVVLFGALTTGEHGSAEEFPELEAASTEKKTKKTVKSKDRSTVTVEPVDQPVEFVPLGEEEAGEAKKKVVSERKPTKTKTVSAKTETGTDNDELKSAEIVAPAAKKSSIKPSMVEYPSDVEGGIYGDTFIDINSDTILKLRTLVVEDIYLM
jgi:hypothetical protein